MSFRALIENGASEMRNLMLPAFDALLYILSSLSIETSPERNSDAYGKAPPISRLADVKVQGNRMFKLPEMLRE